MAARPENVTAISQALGARTDRVAAVAVGILIQGREHSVVRYDRNRHKIDPAKV